MIFGGGSSPSDALSEIGSANLDWSNLGFDYIPTSGHIRRIWKDGEWGPHRFFRDPYIPVHVLGNVFHYGQAIFEGYKVFQLQDGSIAHFADHFCYERMAHGCRRLRMPVMPRDVWQQALDTAVRENLPYVPPYGSGASLYVRPFIFGSGPKLGLGPSPQYTFCVHVNPVGGYYKGGEIQSIHGLVNDEYDRAAPLGCGDVKAAGNYAADLESMHMAKNRGFPISLYLDARERRYVEEFNTSNFVAITKDGTYVTPNSPRSVLDSNTNKMLRHLAEDMGLKVEVRSIDFEAEADNFREVGAVGTAVVVTPIASLTRGDKVWKFDEPNVFKTLHNKLRAIQNGDAEDNHGWLRRMPVLDMCEQKTLASIYPGL